MTAYTKSGVTLTIFGKTICASDGKGYTLIGKTLVSDGRIISNNCRSLEEAFGIVIGLYGGKRF